ncbi:DNA cytosine methyltransferase [Moraxella oculi]|uniref:DNA cytosine methyltransferase n=1 Tax=Moraxella oculi TaxID=2940516 RepID=A0ABW8U6M5_9GAMM
MNLTFMDFCSGIGAGRLGLEQAGMQCVAHSEIDPDADWTYQLLWL